MSTQEQVNERWSGVPSQYVPQVDKPWRVTWGFGVFEDFATEAEAVEFYDKTKAAAKGDWADLVCEPFDAVEVQR